jgi:hypothetical protein
MSAVGRLLRTLRLATRLSVDEAAVVAALSPGRLRELEIGRDLSYLEGLRIAKAYLLCPSCFKRHFEGAIERDMALALAVPPDPDPEEPSLAATAEGEGQSASGEGSNEEIETPYARATLTASR